MLKSAISVIGMGFGDEGKGSIVDYICRTRPVPVVIRFNGGYQAAHNVVTRDGKHHTFSQFGSGTLAGAKTYIGGSVIIEPSALYAEAEHLNQLGVEKPFDLLYVDRNCAIATPYHKAVNRLKEISRGKAKHGSCGLGIGETAEDTLNGCGFHVVHLMERRGRMVERLDRIRARKTQVIQALLESNRKNETFLQEYDKFSKIDFDDWIEFYLQAGNELNIASCFEETRLTNCFSDTKAQHIVFEGAQGVLLDETKGFGVYKTWGNCSDSAARRIATSITNFTGNNVRFSVLGVTRSYTTRHGAGPLPTEDLELTAKLCEQHNKNGLWQGPFRVGKFDNVLFQYAMRYQGAHALAVTHLDKYVPEEICNDYRPNGLRALAACVQDIPDCGPIFKKVNSKQDFLNHLIRPIAIQSFGPTSDDKMTGPNFEELFKSP